MLHSICQQIWKTQQWPQTGKGLWKRFILIPKKGNAKECSNYLTVALISHTSKVVLKSLQTRLQQYMNHELPDVPAGFRKGRGTIGQIANICWIMEKAREFQKNICFIDVPKPLTVWITTNCGKFLKRWEYQTTLPASWEICMQVRRQQNWTWTTDWFQIGKGVHQGCILSPCLYNLYALEMLRIKISRRNIKETSDMQMMPSLWQKVKKN